MLFRSFEIQARDKLIVATERYLVLQFHAVYNGINTLFMKLCKTDAQAAEEQMTSMLGVVKVVGIVYDAFDVAFVVANLHAGFENVFHNDVGMLFSVERLVWRESR